MSNQFLKLRRSAVPGKIPDTGSLALGEIALNTYDGLAFMKKSGSNGEEVVVIGNSSGSFSGSFSGEFTGSLLGTASWAYNALTASTADNFFVRGNITGSNALFTGTVTAQTIVVQTITSSVLYSSGSNVFGNKLTDTQQFTGSVTITGSLTSANVNLTGSFSGSISNLDGATNFIAKFDSPNSVDSSVIYQSASHIAINETNFTVDNPEALYVFQTHPTSINVLTGKGNLNNYLQNNIQNTNQGISASSDVVATANNGNENSNYIDMGINSENYNQNFIGGPNDAYLYSIANNLHIGNANDNGTHVALFVGGVDVDANTKIQLNANNRHTMSGSFSLTGSLNVKEGITGSLFGTSSWAVSASRALSGNGGFSGSFTGSFFGNGAGLTNISASSVVGLNLSLIGSGSVTASTDPAYGFRVNSNTQISGSTQITGSLGLTGSFSVSGSLGSLFSANVDTMVFTGSLFQSGSIQLTGSLNVTRGGITGSLFGTSSWAISASHAPTSLTASFAVSSSLAQTASLAILAPAYTTTASFTQFTSSYYLDSSSFSGSISLLSQSFLQTSSSYASASGSLSTRTTNLELTASVLTTASASFAIVSSSYAALSGSFRSGSYTGSFTGVGNLTGSLFGTSSFASTSTSASFSTSASIAVSASFATSASLSVSASFVTTASFAVSSSNASTASFVLNAISASFAATASFATSSSFSTTASFATTASFVLNAVSASFAATASSADNFLIRQNATASNLLVNNTITAQTLVVQTITSSVDFVTGSTKFGTQLTNTHQFTGSVTITGSLSLNDSPVVTNTTFTPFSSSVSTRLVTLENASSSFASVSSSYSQVSQSLSTRITNLESTASVLTTASASFAQVSASYSALSASFRSGSYTGSFTGIGNLTGSLFGTSSNTISSSFAINATSASLAQTASFVISASFAQTASYVNPLRQNVILSGALDLVPTADPDPTGANIRDTYLFVSASNTTLGYDLYHRQNGNLVKWKWVEGGSLNTGILFGGNVTYSGSFVYISSGSGIIVNYNASTGSEINPIINYVNWGPLTSSITNIATTQVTYLYIDSNGAAQQQSIPFTPQQYSNSLPLGAVGHFNYVSVSALAGIRSTAYGQPEQANQFIDAFGPLKIDGYSISAQPSSLRYSVGSGTSFIHGGFYDNDPNFPSIFDSNSAPTASIVRCYISGSQTVFDTNNGSLYTTINPGFYNDIITGVTSSISNNKWTIQRVFTYPPTNTTYVYYGQNVYDTLVGALDGLSSDTFSEGATQDFTTLIGYLVVKSNTSDLSLTENKILAGGLFRAAGAGGAGGAVAAAALDDLSDVTITSPTNGQALIYNSGIWVNGIPLNATSASLATTASFVLQAVSSSFATSASYAISSSFAVQASTASYVLQAVSASFATTASNATTASFVLQAVSSSFASTASSADNFLIRQNATASNLLVNNTITAQTLVVQTITSSVEFVTGSTKFGTQLTDTHQFTGSVTITGSLSLNNDPVITQTPYNAFSSSIQSRVTTLETASGSLSTRVTNLESTASVLTTASASFAVVSSSYSQASQSLSTRTTNLESTASILTTASASFAIVSSSYATASGSLSTRVTTLENASASFALVSSSYSALSGSFRSGSYTGSFTGTLIGTASWASNAVTSSYILNAVSASFASTASSVNTLNQDVIITSSLTVGANTQGPSENTLTLGPRGASEGGQLGLQAPGGTYTSASMLDNYQDRFRILRGSNAGSDAEIASFNMHTKQFFLPSYNNVSSYPGTAVAYLGVNSSGDVITVSAGTVSSASFASTASLAFTALTASFVTSSNVFGPFGSNSILTSSFATSASFVLNAVSASFVTTASFALTANTASYVLNAISASYVFEAVSASFASTASFATSASFTTTSSFAVSSSNASTASFVLNAISASFAATASSADNFVIRQDATASNLLVNNTITAQTLVVQTVTSSIVYSSGSNIFGNNLNNTQQFTGSVTVTGSLSLNNSPVVTDSILTPISSSVSTRLVTLENASSSFALVSSSYSAFSQSYNTGSFTGSFTGVLIGTASWAQNALTSSYVINAISASYSSTSSFVNTLNQDVVITGSFNTTGSVFLTGLTTSSQANVVGYDVATGQLYFQTAAGGGSSVTASYALTASAATEFTVRNTLTIGSAMSDYSTVASSVVGSNNLFTQAVGSYTSAFFKYTVTNGSNARSGEVMSVWNGTTTQFTDNSTLDVGSTTPVTCSVSIVGSDVQFNIQTNTSGWAIKALATFM